MALSTRSERLLASGYKQPASELTTSEDAASRCFREGLDKPGWVLPTVHGCSRGRKYLCRLAHAEPRVYACRGEWAEGPLDTQSFEKQTSQYAADHPGLVCMTWVDADFAIAWIEPMGPNKQLIGVKLAQPEPLRASKLASGHG